MPRVSLRRVPRAVKMRQVIPQTLQGRPVPGLHEYLVRLRLQIILDLVIQNPVFRRGKGLLPFCAPVRDDRNGRPGIFRFSSAARKDLIPRRRIAGHAPDQRPVRKRPAAGHILKDRPRRIGIRAPLESAEDDGFFLCFYPPCPQMKPQAAGGILHGAQGISQRNVPLTQMQHGGFQFGSTAFHPNATPLRCKCPGCRTAGRSAARCAARPRSD